MKRIQRSFRLLLLCIIAGGIAGSATFSSGPVQAQTCMPATVTTIVRNAAGAFIPSINFDIYKQTLDADNKPKPGARVGGGKIDPTLGKTVVSFVPGGDHYAVKVWDKSATVGEAWFYNQLPNLTCGGSQEQTLRVSGIRFVLRDTQQALKKSTAFKVYQQKNDADGKPIKGTLVGTYDTGTKGEAIAYVTDPSHSLDGTSNGIYVFEATGSQGGVYTKYGIYVSGESTTEVPFVFSDIAFTLKNAQGVLYPANTKVEVYKQTTDVDGQKVVGTKIRDIVTNDKGVAIFENPADTYAARIKGSDGLYKYFWDLRMNDGSRSAIELKTDSDFATTVGSCSTKSSLTVSAKNSDGEYLPGISYELYTQAADANGSPIAAAKIVSGKIGADGQSETLLTPDPTKTYVLKMYDKNSAHGDFWFFDGIKFACGVNKDISKILSSINVILRDGAGNLLTNTAFSLYTQKTTIDGKPIAEKKDLVANLTTSAQGNFEVYVASDHPYIKAKRGTYVLIAKRGSNEYMKSDIQVKEGTKTTVEYTFSDILFTLEDASNTPLPSKAASLYVQLTDAQGRPTHGTKAVATFTTGADGAASAQVPAGTYAFVIKDSANKELAFWNLKVAGDTRNEKTLVTSLVRVTARDATNTPVPEKTVITAYTLAKDTLTGDYYRKAKAASAAIGPNGTATFILAQGAYLFAATMNKQEYADAQYIRDGKLMNIDLNAAPEYLVTASTRFTVDDGIQQFSFGSTGPNRFKGYIYLQVESRGEAWYVDTKSGKRFYLKDGPTAYQAMRQLGIGIKNTDLAKIPIGFDDRFKDVDTDGDRLPDRIESALGTDPNKIDTDGDTFNDGDEVRAGYSPSGTGKLPLSLGFAKTQVGKILLQVEAHGEAWYLNPKDGKRYYMSNGEAAYNIMRFLGQGITNRDLTQIKTDVLK